MRYRLRVRRLTNWVGEQNRERAFRDLMMLRTAAIGGNITIPGTMAGAQVGVAMLSEGAQINYAGMQYGQYATLTGGRGAPTTHTNRGVFWTNPADIVPVPDDDEEEEDE